MPRFKSNANLFVHLDEHYDENWLDAEKAHLPSTKKWTYDREMQIEDVDLWEVIYEATGGKGVYASYIPYAEYYLICTGWKDPNNPTMETYYGPGAEYKVMHRMQELNYPYPLNNVWVDNEDLWLKNPNTRGQRHENTRS